MLNIQARTGYTEEHDLFRNEVRKFLAQEVEPKFKRWEDEKTWDRNFWRAAGAAGLLCPTVPEEFGGLGLDFRYNAVINEETSYLIGNMNGAVLQSDILTDYIAALGTEKQKRYYLPRMISGEVIAAIAMTEPGGGSDLQSMRTTAKRVGSEYIISGSKTYISNGQNCDVTMVAAKSAPELGGKGISLFFVESDREGFRRGRNLDKIGNWSSDTSELFFDDVRIPEENLLGIENRGFIQLMDQLPQERLSLAITAQSAAQRAFDEAVAFTKDRKAFGQTIFDFQNTRFTLADLAAKLQIGWAHIDWAISRHVKGELTTAEASAAKYWHTETQWEIVDAALQLHGGAGYMNEYKIAQLWRDARVQRIVGGTSEIMREIISRSI
ncbi:acyl-CoA dehydrogenase family protein [Kineobactrum salinum]|uniref:Acyl-CoA dehydrogenase n=1 Tax=Kineobactrum salinum TaxID=2708301 RepID=A0A6C0U5F8_9GAMM|nr:acyl-CoA dehydrogenase family protein [Kineobactrum salinum]QIB67402.1 acyl-CoA dehydrogenase [Kineobactrum salinum]